MSDRVVRAARHHKERSRNIKAEINSDIRHPMESCENHLKEANGDFWHIDILDLGHVHKVRHARGGGVWEGVTVCDRRRVKSMWRHAYNFFIIHAYETWNLKWFLTFSCNRCIPTEGGTDKNHPGQNLQDKRPPDKTPRTKTPANNWERICTRGSGGSRIFCLGG